MINLIMLFVGVLGMCFGVKLLKNLLRGRKLKLETYSNKIPALTKMEVRLRNKRRIDSLFLG